MPSFIPGIATQSLGKPGLHDLRTKLSLAATHGFRAVEVFMPDLEAMAHNLPMCYPAELPGYSFSTSTAVQEKVVAAATYTHDLCKRYRLQVICLQPFLNFGGLIDRKRHTERVAELPFWFLLARKLGTDLIQVPSSFLPQDQCNSSLDGIVADMRQIADLGLDQSPPIRFCYEALCWGTQVDTWQQAYSVVEQVDRPNFGTCLDTFNICGRIYADPGAPNGRNADADEKMEESIAMLKKIDLKKVFYIEVVDGERLDKPLDEAHPFHVDGQPTRMSWSRNARLFPCESKGYLPVLRILGAIIDLGYTGHISFEFFSRTLDAPGANVPIEHAERAQTAWNRLSDAMGFNQLIGEPAKIEAKLQPTMSLNSAQKVSPSQLRSSRKRSSLLLSAY